MNNSINYNLVIPDMQNMNANCLRFLLSDFEMKNAPEENNNSEFVALYAN